MFNNLFKEDTLYIRHIRLLGVGSLTFFKKDYLPFVLPA